MTADSEDNLDARPALQQVLHYHESTKHHFQSYAQGPGSLDWATQPKPFRRYQGARLVSLEKFPATDEPLYDDAFVRGRIPAAPVTFQTISQLFYDSLAISAWKSTGEHSWALRVNPSSGNLHPTEGYLICGPIDGLGDRPMVCHYAPKEHGLEVRAEFERGMWDALWLVAPADTFLVGLTSIHWREAWKYGQRAYRYCQHDVGHAIGAIVIAAAGLGWQTTPSRRSESEEPDVLISPWQKSRIRPGPGAAEPRRLHGMAMGKRPVARQASPLWVETADLPTSDGHPFFERLNRVLEDCGFDAFVEGLCSAFYAARMGRPSLRPGRYFRMLLIGYFEGLSSERGIAWRVADSLSLRSFLDLELTESAPDHSTLSRTRRLIDVETHEAVFTWVLERLSEAGLVVGKTVGIDATTLEANAAMRSIERRDTGESYEAFIRRLAEASGVETPTRAELARFDRSRKNKKTSNKEWKSPQDPDAKIAKMKDGRTHLAHKAEHGVDMDTGAIVSVTVQDASDGDTATLPETLIIAAEQVEAVQPEGAGVEEVVADKGYHSDETLVGLGEVGVRSHVSEPERGRRCWQDKKTGETPPEKRAAQKALYANRRRVRGRRGRRLQRRRGEVVERTFAHMYETGGMRRVWVRGHDNVRKRVLLQAAACNIGLLLRRQTGVGTPRSLQGRALSAIYGLIGRWRGCWERLRRVWGLKRSMLHLEAA